MHSGWNRMVQTSKWYTLNDLSKPCIDFKNWRFRKFTFLKRSREIFVFLALIDENRWCNMLKKVYGEETSAQRCTIMEEFANAIGVQDLDSWFSARFPPPNASTEFHHHLHMKNSQRTCENNGELLMNWSKKWMWKWRRSERISEVLDWIWKSDYWFSILLELGFYTCL